MGSLRKHGHGQWAARQGTGAAAPRLRLRVLALGLALVLLLLASGQAWAAVQLGYFRATPTQSSVLLEWATLSEFNVAGFEILCKKEGKPDADYHPIGSRIAQGGPDQGASYSFNVTGKTPGVRYCFRLREVTADDTPGEKFDLCGYGIGIAPKALDVVGDVTPTPIVLQAQPGITPAPTLMTPGALVPGAGEPTPFVTPDPFTSPLDQPTPTATFFPDQPTSPLPTPLGLGPDADTAGFLLTPTVDPLATPTPTVPAPGSLIGGAPQIDPATFVTETPTATWEPTWTPVPTPIQESPLVVLPGEPGMLDPNALDPSQIDPATGAPWATPTPLYLVVTATPTPDTLAAPLPVFTPWPTATQPPVFQATNLLAPTSQNLMVMLLCLIFLSASGLGVLGLVTSVIYMRSQASRDRLPGPYYYDRRRY